MCHYVDTVFVFSLCTSKHRVTNRVYTLCSNPNPLGTYRHCRDATPDPKVVLGSTKRNRECPVCKGERQEVVVVRLSYIRRPKRWGLMCLVLRQLTVRKSSHVKLGRSYTVRIMAVTMLAEAARIGQLLTLGGLCVFIGSV